MVTLGILTCFAYPFYWLYKTWRDLAAWASEQDAEATPELAPFREISPMLRTVALLVPFALTPFMSVDPFLRLLPLVFYAVNLYLVLSLVRGIAGLHPDAGSFPRRRPLLSSGLILTVMIAFISLSVLPGALFMLSFLGIVPLAVVQHWLNAYWAAVEPPGLNVRQAFSFKELIAIIVGAGLLGLIATSFFVLPR